MKKSALVLIGGLAVSSPAFAQTSGTAYGSGITQVTSALPTDEVLLYRPGAVTATTSNPGGYGLRRLVGPQVIPGIYRGAWAASTAYNANDLALQGGLIYSANTAFTSGSTFNASNWTAITSASVVIGTTSGTAADAALTNTAIATKEPLATITTGSCSTGSQTLSAPSAYDLTLTANCALTLGTAASGAVRTTRVFLRQSGSGGFVVTLPSGVKWPGGTAPTPNTSASGIDVFTFRTPDGGTTWFGGN